MTVAVHGEVLGIVCFVAERFEKQGRQRKMHCSEMSELYLRENVLSILQCCNEFVAVGRFAICRKEPGAASDMKIFQIVERFRKLET